MIKYKLGSEMCGYTYDTLIKYYPSLAELPFISKETFSTNPDDPDETEDYMIITINEREDLITLKKTIEKDIPSTKECEYIGVLIESFDEEDIQWEKYDDMIISYR